MNSVLSLPWSLTARVSSASTMLSARSIERRTRTAMSVSCRAVGDGLARVTSMAVRITVSGVRSSCEALATNRRWVPNATSRRSSMSSNVSASSLSSSLAPVSASRSPRCCSDARRAVSVITRTGRSTRPDMTQPSPPDATVMTARPASENTRSSLSARWRCACKPAAVPAVYAASACLHAARRGVGIGTGRLLFSAAPSGLHSWIRMFSS